MATLLFSHESRFSLTGHYRRTFIWREPGIRSLPSNIQSMNHYGSEGLMVWVGITLDGHVYLRVCHCDYSDERDGGLEPPFLY
ncbi:hypothetical protein TNCV_1199391 [Trichonephila clavipes]|uniref:Uncharacterized protein n=1 Tax=Trichonephila clavipes TaxID=2585209 RepID=A0A8X6S905_TRICX|nr:hypothetical protein TNCV_1199391 [Trichonephila clavipes]